MIFMNRLFPDLHKKDIYEIDYRGLYNKGFRAVLFDIDNTLTTHGQRLTGQILSFLNLLGK